MSKRIERIGPHLPWPFPPDDEFYICTLWTEWQKEGYRWVMRGDRINGFNQCPKCGLWWPYNEDPCAWEEGDDRRLFAIEWWGHAVCTECDLILVDQPDGTPEAYYLP